MDAGTLERGRERNKRWRLDRPQKYLWCHARARAGRKGVPFAIAPEDIPMPTHCAVLGIELAYGTVGREGRDRAASVHRIVPDLGYVPGNIMVISFRANYLIANGTADEFRAVLSFLGRAG